MSHTALAENSEAIPPIVLFVGDDADLYVTALESAGLWVSTATDPDEALATANELRPDAVVAAVSKSAARYDEVMHLLKHGARTQNIPLLLLSNGDATPETTTSADVQLRRPVAAETLVLHVRELVQHSRELRVRSDEARARAKTLVKHSTLILKGRENADRGAAPRTDRPCPKCGSMLFWIERGRLAGVEYDYFRWCRSGCGLYCFDRSENTWVKLT